jgi:phosphoglycerol transferase MdoB-like AlkP superfamily enzyme
LQDATIKTNIPDSTLYKFRSNEKASKLIADDFYVEKDTTISILKNPRPNLVFIFLESWSSDNISVLGGIEDCTPQFNALCKEGLLFTNAYANAYVSDQGIPAILSAYPSVSRVAIINQAAKVPSLPCMSEELVNEGYSLSFMFGGDLVYGNLRGYLLEKKFNELKEQKDFSQHPSGRLGVHDEFTFPELLKNLNNKKEPFLQGFFTVSSHMPYDYKPSDDWKSNRDDPEKLYTESVHYCDLHLGKFFTEAKFQSWYKNTLFVVVADHSHNTIKQWGPSNAKHSHIPMLFLGGALKEEWKGKSWDKIVSQLDMPTTLFKQMNIKTTRYPWSRNIFNPLTNSSAYYIFFGGIGYISEEGYAASHIGNTFHIDTDIKDSASILKYNNKAMSFQQLVYEDVRTRK